MRLFIAIELSDEVRAALAEVQRGLKEWSNVVRWVNPGQLHMTLKFLGEAPEPQAAEIAVALSASTCDQAPFDLALVGCGCFPPRGPVRIVWVAMNDETGRLLSCVQAVEAKMEEIGFPREDRPFAPHLTIGRVREDRSGVHLRAAVEAAKARSVRQCVSCVTLMSSRLSPKGASYSVVSQAKLACGPGS